MLKHVGCAAGLTLGLMQNPSAMADATLVVVVDQAKLMKVPPGTASADIANTDIADVTLLRKNNMVIVTPKMPGRTTMVLRGDAGDVLVDTTIESVSSSAPLTIEPPQ